MLSRLPMNDVMLGVRGAVAPFDEPRLAAATISAVRVYSIYAPNGRKVGTDAHRFKLAWFEFLGHVLASELEDYDELILLADLNIAPTDRACGTHRATAIGTSRVGLSELRINALSISDSLTSFAHIAAKARRSRGGTVAETSTKRTAAGASITRWPPLRSSVAYRRCT